MSYRFPGLARWLGIAGCLVWSAGCASQSSSLLPARVDGVPGGTYHVMVSEHPATGQKYDAVLFETDTASVTLDVPTVDQGRGAPAAVYQAGMRPGAVVYEIRNTAGKVHGYLMVPSQARVRVWEQTGKGGALVVTVSDVENMPEMGGGGAGGGGGM
jgi:hypothetical protein